jgi:hypothetical protein
MESEIDSVISFKRNLMAILIERIAIYANKTYKWSSKLERSLNFFFSAPIQT